MQLQYAGDNLKPIPSEHLLARKAADLPGVKKMAGRRSRRLSCLILEHSPGHKATPTQIAALLTPDVLSGEAEFKRWWEGAKKHLKKTAVSSCPPRRRISLRCARRRWGRTRRSWTQFKNARQLKAQLAALDQIYKNIEDFKADPGQLAEVLTAAGAAAVRNQRLDVNAAFELLVTRDEIAAAAVGGDLSAATATPSLAGDDARGGKPPGRDHRQPARRQAAISRSTRCPPRSARTNGRSRALSLLPQTHNARVVGEVARLFDAQGRTEEVRTFLDRSIRDYSVTCEMLLWLCKERHDEKYADFANPAPVQGDPLGAGARRVQRHQAQHAAARRAFQRPRTHHRVAQGRRRGRVAFRRPRVAGDARASKNSTNAR